MKRFFADRNGYIDWGKVFGVGLLTIASLALIATLVFAFIGIWAGNDSAGYSAILLGFFSGFTFIAGGVIAIDNF